MIHPVLQLGPTNYWGQVGHRLNATQRTVSDPIKTFEESTVYYEPGNETYWYRFMDTDPVTGWKRPSSRTVSSKAVCERVPLEDDLENKCANYGSLLSTFVLNNTEENYEQVMALLRKEPLCDVWQSSKELRTTWASNYSSFLDDALTEYGDCGNRCQRVIALQTAGAITDTDDYKSLGQKYIPRLNHSAVWSCTNTVSEIQGATEEDYNNLTAAMLPNMQAAILAGSIAWSGQLETLGQLLYTDVMGDFNTGYNLGEEATEKLMAALIMKFTVGTIAAMDQQGGPRKRIFGNVPKQPLLLKVRWGRAAPMLTGLPAAQLVMLFAVVWFSGKAIILEPSYLTMAKLFQPVMQKLGPDGALMTSDEISEALGTRFKVAYAVRPEPLRPRTGTVKIRELGLVEESEGFGYVRGKFPEGKYA